MTLVLLRMAHLTTDVVDKREIAVPNITTLKSLCGTIQNVFSFSNEGTVGYEVLGCAAPGYHAKLRDLVTSGITRFRYLQNGTSKKVVEIAIISLPPAARAEKGAR